MQHPAQTIGRWTAAGAAVLLTLSATQRAACQDAAATSEPKALAVADQMMTALGGEANWVRMRFIKFTFIRGETRLMLTWDKWTGRYRLDSATKAGRPAVVLMNINTKQGEAYLDGERLDGEARDTYLERAFRVWKGETYWLLMPYKLRDPGVILGYAGEETIDGTTYDIIHVGFNGPGMGANDEFWAYISRTTHLMDKWRYRLGRGFEGEFWWRDWRRFGPLMLSTRREPAGGGGTIRMEAITVTDAMPDSVFASPAPVTEP